MLSTYFKTKFFINSVVIFLIIFAIVFFFSQRSWWPGFYSPIFLGWAFFVSAALITLPKYIFRTTDPNKQAAIRLLRLVLAFALLLNALGEIYLYQLYKFGFPYDKVIHFLNSFLFLIGLTVVIKVWFGWSVKRALLVAAVIVVLGSFIWELLEFLSDYFFKTSEFGINGQDKFWDTFFDIVADLLGVCLASLILSQPKLAKIIIKEYCQDKLLESC